MNLLQMSFTGAVMILAVTVIGSTGGVVKSPFFKDMAVSKEVSPCPFSLLIAPLIYTG